MNGWVGMGPLLFFVPVVLLMAITYLAMWLLGRRAGRTGDTGREFLLLLLIVGFAAALVVVAFWFLEEVLL